MPPSFLNWERLWQKRSQFSHQEILPTARATVQTYIWGSFLYLLWKSKTSLSCLDLFTTATWDYYRIQLIVFGCCSLVFFFFFLRFLVVVSFSTGSTWSGHRWNICLCELKNVQCRVCLHKNWALLTCDAPLDIVHGSGMVSMRLTAWIQHPGLLQMKL